jgi:hypothetical protein
MNIKSIIYNALILIKEGKWDDAHEIAQSKEGHPDYDRLHAYLHRIEGDEWNARYWYRRIGIDFPVISEEEELEALISLYGK